MKTLCVALCLLVLLPFVGWAQSMDNHWSAKERQLRYRPDGTDFVIVNGDKKFNRALYGTETPFRFEAGDLPEFAMYMQGFGGNIHLGIIKGDKSIWLPQAQTVEARYKGAGMVYNIRDGLLGNATLTLTVLALANAEGVVVKVQTSEPLADVTLCWAYGGATGKKFRRDGDLNTDPESVFYLKADNCQGSLFNIRDNTFELQYGAGRELTEAERYEIPGSASSATETKDLKGGKKLITGCFPVRAVLAIGDANALTSPLSLLTSAKSDCPVLVGSINGLSAKGHCLLWRVPKSINDGVYVPNAGEIAFNEADASRKQLVGRIQLVTPDPYINTLGPTLAAAADGIWETPTYMHGAIGWRMRLNGWRGPYTANPMGWNDRAEAHFNAYAKSQVTSPESGPSVPDPKTNLARQQEKMGNALFTSGYICRNPDGDFRPHHYDMNLVFIDGLLRHFRWTGDTAFVRQMWPVLTRHLAWEKRNFDGDNDGLYDAYCCIWASDALEYSGGGVAHSSAYNYLANKMAAQLAPLVGADAAPYQLEADKILQAIRTRLWLPGKGWYAEYVDWSGLKRTHDAAALWTIYHVLDSEVADPFDAWQATRYIDSSIPKLPVKGAGLTDDGYYVHSTTNWQPYDWSINNVVMAENLHTALAYWQAGRGDAAFHLWKSTLLDAMYLGGSPGNFVQLSFLDAARGEMYRDFADEVGMTARSLVEGLFGIQPNLLDGIVTIAPGFPKQWDNASLTTPYINYQYVRNGMRERYAVTPAFPRQVRLAFRLPAKASAVKWVKVNGKKVAWKIDPQSVGAPILLVDGGIAANCVVEVQWGGDALITTPAETVAVPNEPLSIALQGLSILAVNDPQHVLADAQTKKNTIGAKVTGAEGHRTLFAKVKQGQMVWWMPIALNISAPLQIVAANTPSNNGISFSVVNHLPKRMAASICINHVDVGRIVIVDPQSPSETIAVDASHLMLGTNLVELKDGAQTIASANIANWGLAALPSSLVQEPIDMQDRFNQRVTQIFKTEYLEPRWPFPTLQLPKHGVGNWCYNNIHPLIDDSGLRGLSKNGVVETSLGIRFNTPSDSSRQNILFASLYNNYAPVVQLPLAGVGKHIYLLMAGSTNPMQSQMVNGVVKIYYTDGSFETLELKNPDNWTPIEQDYFNDGYAFSIPSPMPPRLHLKTGVVSSGTDFKGHASINGYSNRIIDGGAANILDMPLDGSKTLQKLVLEVQSNEVVMGIMGVTVVR